MWFGNIKFMNMILLHQWWHVCVVMTCDSTLISDCTSANCNLFTIRLLTDWQKSTEFKEMLKLDGLECPAINGKLGTRRMRVELLKFERTTCKYVNLAFMALLVSRDFCGPFLLYVWLLRREAWWLIILMFASIMSLLEVRCSFLLFLLKMKMPWWLGREIEGGFSEIDYLLKHNLNVSTYV